MKNMFYHRLDTLKLHIENTCENIKQSMLIGDIELQTLSMSCCVRIQPYSFWIESNKKNLDFTARIYIFLNSIKIPHQFSIINNFLNIFILLLIFQIKICKYIDRLFKKKKNK